MKKFSLALAALLIMGIIVFIVMVTYGDRQPGFRPGGLREQVISVALTDPQVQNILRSSDKITRPEYIPPGETGIYLNNSTRYAGVSFHTSVAQLEQISLTIIVDTATMKEMGVFYSGLPRFMNSWVIIPPGNGIYEMMTSSYNLSWPKKYAVPEISSGASTMNMTPSDAKLYPIIVNEDNLKKYMNGSPYQVPGLIDPDTRDIVYIDGNKPLASGWKGLYELPPDIQSYKWDSDWDTRYYLILLNRDANDEVKIVYEINLLPLIYDLPVPTTC